MTIRIGILGAGFMGSTHARALMAIPDVEIAGIYGLYGGAGRTAGGRTRRILDQRSRAPDRRSPASMRSIFACPDRNIARSTERAIAAGKHVLLEKPITLRDRGCRRPGCARREDRSCLHDRPCPAVLARIHRAPETRDQWVVRADHLQALAFAGRRSRPGHRSSANRI